MHPVLLQHDEMRSFADLHQPFVGTVRELLEQCLRGRDAIIPLRNDDQSRRLDPSRIVVCLAGVPVIAIVLKYAGRAAQYRRLLL